jgi:hypothetical protein
MGGKGVRQRRAAAARLAALAPDEARAIVAAGKFVGEGFDDARPRYIVPDEIHLGFLDDERPELGLVRPPVACWARVK